MGWGGGGAEGGGGGGAGGKRGGAGGEEGGGEDILSIRTAKSFEQSYFLCKVQYNIQKW